MILLDTHVVLWLAAGDRRLGRKTETLVERTRARGEAAVSAFSWWEVGMLAGKARVTLLDGAGGLRRRALEEGLLELSVDGDVALRAAALDGFHGDPADRIVVATALLHDAAVVTAGGRILEWKGTLRRHDARR